MTPTSRLINLSLPSAPSAIQNMIEYAGLIWLDIRLIREEQIAFLRERFGFHTLHLNELLSPTQRPKLDDNDDPEYLLLIMHLPIYDEQSRLPVINEVEIFVGSDFVVTCHSGHIRPLVHLVQDAKSERVQQQLMSRGSGYLLYSILSTLLDTCAPLTHELYRKLDQIDHDMFRRNVQQTVEELSFLRRDIISLRRIIRPNIPVLSLLADRERPFLHLDEETYFGALTDKLSKLWDMLEEQKEIIEGLDATLSSLTSHRINQEMRTFTLISLIFLPMTLVASILGMNVVIPYADSPLSLVVAMLLIFGLAAAFFVYFRHKRWV